jgi:segregation and condensation protein B
MPSQSATNPSATSQSATDESAPSLENGNENGKENGNETGWEYPRGQGRPLSLSLPARLEAILYLKGRPLSLGELAEIASVSREDAEMALITLMADYAHRDTALEIHQDGQRYSLQLRESLGDLVQDLLPIDLSTAALRTLATIALKKRLLQSDLVDLRGSGAYDHIKELLAQGFIERKRQSEGRSYWLSLSEKFHRTFSVRAEDLPSPRSGEGAASQAVEAA